MPALRVYADPRSTCSRKVLLVLAEKQLRHELIKIDLSTGGQKDPRYKALHPWGKVPVLQNLESGLTLYESLAIIRYLEALSPSTEPRLVPSDLGEYGNMEQWLSISYSYFKPIQMTIQMEMVLKQRYGRGEPDMTVVNKAREELEPVLDVFNARLEKAPYLAGAQYSLADVAYMPEMDMLEVSRSGDLIEKRPALADWWSRVSSRPAWKEIVSIAVEKGATALPESA